MLFVIYGLIALLVIFFSIKSAYYLDTIEEKTKLSGLFLSSVILASITSLPELVTSVSAISFLDSPNLVLGNILGSNIFNLMILGSFIIIFFQKFLKSKIDPLYDKSLYLLIIIYCLLFSKLNFNFDVEIMNVDIVSIIISALYFISLKYVSAKDENNLDIKTTQNNLNESLDIKNKDTKLRKTVIKFIISSLGLIVTSVMMTITTDKIVASTSIGATMAGAIFLGVATSIPELATSITLCKLGNFNAVFGNMIGSCIFNYIIITIGDILYKRGSIYILDNESYKLTIFGLVSVILTLIILKTKTKDGEKSSLNSKLTYIISSLFILSSYCLFLFL